MKVLNPTSGFPAWVPNKDNGNPSRPVGFNYRTSRGLGETDSSLGGHKQNFVHIKTQRRGAVTPEETEPKLPASVRGPPVEVWVGRGSPQRWGHC